MSSSPFRDRRYSPAEVRDLVRRAAQSAEGEPTSMALTLEEITQHAEPLGIGAEAIRSAAQGGGKPATETPIAGRIVLERVLDPDATDEEIVEVIRAEMGEIGHVEVLGQTLTWTPVATRSGSARPISVRIRRRDGQTLVRIEERLGAAAVIGWVAVALPIALAGGINALLHPFILGHYALGIGLFALVMTVSAALGSTITGAIRTRRSNQIRLLAERLQQEFPVRTRTRIAEPALEKAPDDAIVEASESETDAQARAGQTRP